MCNHIRRWNIWRKRSLNGPIYKILVLFGVTKSPTMGFVLLPEEVRDCFNCKKHGTLDCPNSSLCHALYDKPYFEAKERRNPKCWI